MCYIGNYLLGVHVADIAYFVQPGSQVDREAMKRSSDNGRHLTMLPQRLSHDICGFKPDEDRLALSLFFTIDKMFAIKQVYILYFIHITCAVKVTSYPQSS